MGKTYEAPSRRSLVSLDALYFILADVRGGLGPFLADSRGCKRTLLIGFAVLPIRGLLYTLSDDHAYLVAVQMLDGVGARIFGVVEVLIIADLTRVTGRFNLTQGAVATATGLGGALSNVVTGIVVQAAGFDAGFLTLAAIAMGAFAFFALAMPESQRSLADRGERAMAATKGVALDIQ